MSLHDKLMNLRHADPLHPYGREWPVAFLNGHEMGYRDARHVAAELANEADAEIERLQDMLFALGAMEDQPCFCCGYQGAGYFQPEKHSCATRHHRLSVAMTELYNLSIAMTELSIRTCETARTLREQLKALDDQLPSAEDAEVLIDQPFREPL